LDVWIIQQILTIGEQVPPVLMQPFVAWLAVVTIAQVVPLKEIGAVLIQLFPKMYEFISDDISRAFLPILKPILKEGMEKFRPNQDYNAIPSMEGIYQMFKFFFLDLGPQCVIDFTVDLFRKVFYIPFKGIGYFVSAVKHWKEFIAFHRWLLEETGVEIPFPGKLPSEYQDILQLYESCLICDRGSFDEAATKLCDRVHKFELWLHRNDIRSDEAF
jgi:hypothetical protein